MRPDSVIRVLNTCLNIHRPVFVWGPPGVGKSEVVAQVAKQRKISLLDVRLSQMDPVDIRGLPSKGLDGKEEVAVWLRPGFLPTKGKGILFLDELNSAPPATQAAAYQLVLDRKLGDYTLPAGWDIVAAGNRSGDRAVVHTMPSALASRLLHIDFEVHNDDWLAHATRSGIEPAVIGYIRFRPSALHNFDPKTNPRAFPTPRTWFFASQVVADQSLPDGDLFDLLSGTVGESVAGEFMAFLKVMHRLPSFEDIIAKPTTIAVPTALDELYAITSMMAPKTTKANADAATKFIMRLPIEFQVAFLRTVWAADTTLLSLPISQKWIQTNGTVMI